MRLREQHTQLDRIALSVALSAGEQEDRLRELAAARQEQQDDGAIVRSRLQSARAQEARLKRQIAELDSEWRNKQKLLAGRRAETEALQERAQSARALAQAETRRLRDALAAGELRGERILLLDPGVVPERPVSPDFVLNIAGGAVLGAVIALLWLSLGFALKVRRASEFREQPRAMAGP